MAMRRASPAEIFDLGPLGSGLKDARTTAIVKTETFEAVRLIQRSHVSSRFEYSSDAPATAGVSFLSRVSILNDQPLTRLCLPSSHHRISQTPRDWCFRLVSTTVNRQCLRASRANLHRYARWSEMLIVEMIARIRREHFLKGKNEGAISVGTRVLTGDMNTPVVITAPDNGYLLMIADGMGGHRYGARDDNNNRQASQGCKQMNSATSRPPVRSAPSDSRRSLRAAHGLHLKLDRNHTY